MKHTRDSRSSMQHFLFCLSMAVALLLSITVPSGPTSAAVTVTVGPNVNVTKQSGNQAEGTIAINPTNTQQLFFASNPGATARRSTDGGTTWVAAGAGIGASCCDNVAAWDSFGNLFLVNINSSVNAIVLYLSIDGGATFSLLQTIDTGNIDQPSVKAGAGSVWVTWNDGTIKARGAAVTGLGMVGAFTAEQAAPNADTVVGQFGDIAIGPNGEVAVTYQSNTNIYVNVDTDGLGPGGFGPQVLVTSTNVAKFDFIPAQSTRSVDAEANLAWDRSGGPFHGRLYLVYTDETPDESNDTDIFVRFSDDNGVTWSSAVRVNDDVTTRSQFLPNISLDQTTGNVAVTWHDARNDAANNNTQFFGAVSDTGGASFGANFQISAGTSNDDTAQSGVDYGDYTWSDFHDSKLHVVWADNSNSTGDNPDGANSRFDMYTAAITVKLEVAVDIHPQSCPNPLNVSSQGVLPAAILGTATFAVTQVDVATVRLEGVPPLQSALEDVATPFEPFIGKKQATDCTTAGPDGFLDLTLKFDTQAVVAALGPVTDGEVLVLQLTGQLFDGTPIVGEDVVVILKKR